MKTKFLLYALLTLVAVVVSGCGLAGNLLGGGKGSTVSSLWSDVPAPPSASKVDMNIPPLANLLVQGFVTAANSDSSNDTKLDKFDFVAYSSPDTPEQIAEFYTLEKMQALGWNSDDTPGCQAGAGDSGSAGFCAFGKKDASGNQGTVLLIMPVRDDSANKTDIFFLRFEASKK